MADDYLTLTTFEPGTKAKAQEVNANFTTLKTAIQTKAPSEGSPIQTFSVADATATTHAINKKQLDDLSKDLTTQINRTYPRFCVHKGNTTDGQADLFIYSGLTITPKIGGTYANLIISDYTGLQTTISSASTLILSSMTDGTYNIFITADGTLSALKNTIYRQATTPTMSVDDIWLDISKEPLSCVKRQSSGNVEFLGVPVGQVVIASGAISSVTTFKFNKNGYNAANDKVSVDADNFSATGKTKIVSWLMPDLANGISKTAGTSYTAEQDGWIYCLGASWSDNKLTVNGKVVWKYYVTNADAEGNGVMTLIAKGSTYIATGNISNFVFYPMKGAN